MTHERVDGKTPAGGDYSEIYYLNDHDDFVDEKEATHCAVRECLKDGTLIKETFCKIK